LKFLTSGHSDTQTVGVKGLKTIDDIRIGPAALTASALTGESGTEKESTIDEQ